MAEHYFYRVFSYVTLNSLVQFESGWLHIPYIWWPYIVEYLTLLDAFLGSKGEDFIDMFFQVVVFFYFVFTYFFFRNLRRSIAALAYYSGYHKKVRILKDVLIRFIFWIRFSETYNYVVRRHYNFVKYMIRNVVLWLQEPHFQKIFKDNGKKINFRIEHLIMIF
jgi:hypothetical protein